MTEQKLEPAKIDVGKDAASGLRLWSAQEALRQGEARVLSQQTTYANFLTRANASIGWSVTLTAAYCAGSTQDKLHWLIYPAVFTTGSAFLAACAFCSRRMATPGDDPQYVMDSGLNTELEITEALAIRIQRDIALNVKVISELKEYMDMAFILLAISTLFTATLAAINNSIFT